MNNQNDFSSKNFKAPFYQPSSRTSTDFDKVCEILQTIEVTKDIANYRNLKQLQVKLTPGITTFIVKCGNSEESYSELCKAINEYNKIKV